MAQILCLTGRSILALKDNMAHGQLILVDAIGCSNKSGDT